MMKTAEFSEAERHFNQNTRRRNQEDKNRREREHSNFKGMSGRLENGLTSFMLKYMS